MSDGRKDRQTGINSSHNSLNLNSVSSAPIHNAPILGKPMKHDVHPCPACGKPIKFAVGSNAEAICGYRRCQAKLKGHDGIPKLA